MAKHRVPKPQWRKLLVALTSLVFAAGLAASLPAGATTGPIIGHLTSSGNDGYDQGACSFNVQSVNESAGTVSGQMGGQSGPVSGNLLGYVQIVHNDITCYLYDGSGFTRLYTLHKGADAPSVGTGVVNVTVPRYTQYELCGFATYTLRSGTVRQVNLPCSVGPQPS
jgi:hypothetical protein